MELLSENELKQEPINVVEIAEQYREKVFSTVGYPHRKRLHHMFSRGTISKRTRRKLVRPLPHNI